MKRSPCQALAFAVLIVLPLAAAAQTATPEPSTSTTVVFTGFTPEVTVWPAPPLVTEPSTAPMGVTLNTTIELDEPDPLALTVPMPPLAINPGTTVTLRPSAATEQEISSVTWTKNGDPIAVAAISPPHGLLLTAVTSADSGSYRATFSVDGVESGTVFAHILVRPGINHPLKNISTRATINSSNPQLIAGFSIPEEIAAEYRPKKLLIRAVGETLAGYDVLNPLPDPEVHIYDATGNEVTLDRVFSDVVYDDGTTPESRYYESVAAAAQAVGAFPVPVPGPESPPISEFSELAELPPGSYTVVVSSAGGQSGDVLVEVYEVEL